MGATLMTCKINMVVCEFAKHGFITTPLSRRKIASLLGRGMSIDKIYKIGCDVYAGFTG